MTTWQRNAHENIQTRIHEKREIPIVVKTNKNMPTQNKISEKVLAKNNPGAGIQLIGVFILINPHN